MTSLVDYFCLVLGPMKIELQVESNLNGSCLEPLIKTVFVNGWPLVLIVGSQTIFDANARDQLTDILKYARDSE